MLKFRKATQDDLDLLTDWNRQLQQDESAQPMDSSALLARLERWLHADYQAALFENEAGQAVGYALFRPSDPDHHGPGAIYLRQFFIVRDQRRRGLGSAAFALFQQQRSGHRKIIIDVLTANPIGHRFWQSVGFASYCTTYHHSLDGSHGRNSDNSG